MRGNQENFIIVFMREVETYISMGGMVKTHRSEMIRVRARDFWRGDGCTVWGMRVR